jgi:hypothetical protein
MFGLLVDWLAGSSALVDLTPGVRSLRSQSSRGSCCRCVVVVVGQVVVVIGVDVVVVVDVVGGLVGAEVDVVGGGWSGGGEVGPGAAPWPSSWLAGEVAVSGVGGASVRPTGTVHLSPGGGSAARAAPAGGEVGAGTSTTAVDDGTSMDGPPGAGVPPVASSDPAGAAAAATGIVSRVGASDSPKRPKFAPTAKADDVAIRVAVAAVARAIFRFKGSSWGPWFLSRSCVVG